MRQIAFVGVGLMGAGMAARLTQGGFNVRAYDVSETSRKAAAAAGIDVTDSLADAVAQADVILSSLPNSAIAVDAWTRPDGVLSLARAGVIGIELSSIDPDSMKQIAAAAAKKKIRLVDAPVSGGPAEAAGGSLVLFTGGDKNDIAEVDDVLAAISSARLYTGDVGTGKAVKLVNNMMGVGNIVVAAEAFALGTRAGVEPKLLFEVLSQGGGRSHHFIKRFPKAIDGNFEPGFKMELGEKDIALAIEFGRALGQPTPAASAVREVVALGLATGHRGQDIVAVLDLYNKMNKPHGG